MDDQILKRVDDLPELSHSEDNGDDFSYSSVVLDAFVDAVVACDADGYIHYVNKAAEHLFNLPASNTIGKHITEVACNGAMGSSQKSELNRILNHLSDINTTQRLELTACAPHGSELAVEMRLVPLHRHTRPIIAAFLRDISDQKEAGRFADGQRQILEMIIRAADPAEIFVAIARLLEAHMPGALCSILLLDKEKRLRHVAGPSLPKSYCDYIDGTHIGSTVGSCGTAAYLGETVIVVDIAQDELWEDYRQVALDCGLCSCWSTPLWGTDHSVVGTIAVYYREPRHPLSHEFALVDAVSHLASLTVIDQQAREKIQESENRFRSVLEYSQDGNYRANLLTGTFDYLSPAITPISGYTVDELAALGVQGFMDRIHPDDRATVDAVVAQVERRDPPAGNVEYRWLGKDGNYRWLNDRFTVLLDSNGEALYWLGSLQDVTARRTAEALLRASNDRYDKQHRALTRLTRSQVLQTANLTETLLEITETVAQVIEVERVSLWRFDPTRTMIVCHELYEKSTNRHSSGVQLRDADYPSYFEAMATTEVISADDARKDPRTAEFRNNYLVPLDICSMLNAPIQLGGALEGVVCLEHVGNIRHWMSDEQTFVISIANLVSLILSRWELARAEEAIRNSEANLANAQRIARLGSWTWNLTTGEQHWSAEAFELLGILPPYPTPRHEIFLERVHPDDVERLKTLIDRTCRTGVTYETEYRVVQPSGVELVLQEQAEVRRDENGEATIVNGTILDITLQKRAEERLLYDALHDSLTGLANRTLFNDHLEIAFLHFQRHPERRLAVIMADLDKFKNVNDTLGHPIGDQVLQEAARRVRDAVRAEDTVARLGGDEFAVLLDEIDGEDTATRVAQRIMDNINLPFLIGDLVLDISVSLGVVVVTASHISAESIIRDADIALYRAKKAGRGGYQVFDLDMHTRIIERLELEVQLRHAIERGELSLYLQPIISLGTGTIASFEALLRWKHPHKGFVSPAVFIPIAEETKLIITIGNWVAREACSIIKNWPGDVAPPISINVSPMQLLHAKNALSDDGEPLPQWDQIITEIASEAGIRPELLGIEITESVLISDPSYVSKVLDRLVSHGFRLLLDDFGSGYSSLSYLQDLPFTHIKLDRAFTARLGADTRSYALMRGIITLAHNIGKKVIAEGVENEEQLALLKEAGCGKIQGYLVSHPIPVDEAHKLYHSSRTW